MSGAVQVLPAGTGEAVGAGEGGGVRIEAAGHDLSDFRRQFCRIFNFFPTKR